VKHRVYDDRTNETLFSSEDKLECMMFICLNIEEDSDDFEHIWIGDEN
jgi:hypothetical protein